MHTQQLNVNQLDYRPEIEHSKKAVLLAEIAERLKELSEEESRHYVHTVISKLYNLACMNHESLWMTVDLLTGNMDAITRSYFLLGQERGRSKQGHQQAVERVLLALRLHYPQMEQAFIQLRHITAEIGPVQVKVTQNY